jgi:hypothetical protein
MKLPDESTMIRANENSRRFFLKASSMLGLRAVFSPAAIGETFGNSNSSLVETLRRSNPAPGGADPADEKNTFRPFHVSVPDAELADLRRRVKATKLPDRETVNDAT